ncbi:MAG: heparinase II/III family protein, partial [Candidatus Latescibacteria bacterium]|nr:heparinase II/III family protein [Candidatus Latescibacterota bacterium]
CWRDGDPLFDLLREKQASFGLDAQDTVDRLCRHFEEHVVREGLQAIMQGDVARNEPGDQVTVAILAVALDAPDTDEWLDWIFREGYRRGETPSGGHIPQLFSTEIDRDGVGSEAAPSYSLGWLYKGLGMDNLDYALRARPSYTRHCVRDYVRFREMFLAHVRMVILGRYVPPIGDTGKTGEPSLCGLSLAQCLKGYELFGDPTLAQAAHHLASDDLEKIRGAITDADPEEIRTRVKEAAEMYGPLQLESDVMTGYGLALLRDGEDENERTLWIYYGRNRGHGHADRLNLGLYGFGLDLLPDLGYPEHARVWPKRIGWTSNTVSHNTVVVDRKRQTGTYSGKVDFVAIADGAQAVAVSSPDVYPQCSAYGRCSVLVRISDADFYVVDLFRVSGGQAHHLLFHAAEGEATAGGMDLVTQKGGTYAGEHVGFGEFYDGELKGYTGSGFQYLYDVRRCAEPDRVAWVDWQVKDTWMELPASKQAGEPTVTDIHLRWNLMGPPGEVALCHGDPPQTKTGNPRRLTYAVAAHAGEDPVETTFLSLIEAYRGSRAVQDVEEVSAAGGDGVACRALAVSLRGDRRDTVIVGDGTTRLRVDGRIDFDGLVGIYSEIQGEARWAVLVGGRVLGTEASAIRREAGIWTGKVVSRGSGKIVTDAELPDDGSIDGCYLSVVNDNERDACYRIR